MRRYTFAELAPIVERSRCRIVRGTRLPSGDTAWHVECPSHEAKVLLLSNLAELDSRQPEVIELARSIAASTDHSAAGIARALLGYVGELVDFLPESVELFRPTQNTIEDGIGDCDCSARAYLALARAAGLKAGLATLGQPPTHVAPVVNLGRGRWVWAETSVRGAELGEHPIEAARRLGVALRPELERPELGALDVLEDRTEISIQMASLVALGLLGELGAKLWLRHQPSAAELVAVAVVGAWTPIVLHGITAAVRRRSA